jgi:class 3 adenylate cyclase/alpha-beta hydrolase superfamily lysophospholipase
VRPETRYTDVGDTQVAYQVHGSGPDLVLAGPLASHLDSRWDYGPAASFYTRLGSFVRVIAFDRRGTGASDPLPTGGTPSWEDWVDDLNAVMEATGTDRPSVLGTNDSGPMAMLFAATHPDKVASLVLHNTSACVVQAPDYPFGIPTEFQEPFLATIEQSWGKEDSAFIRLIAPDEADDPEFTTWFAQQQRSAMTPRRAALMWRLILQMDVRQALPLIRNPTLIVASSDYTAVGIDNARYLAEHIEGAKLLELKSRSGISFFAEPNRFLAAIEEHVTGEQREVEPDRVLATVLFTDIVGSTERANQLGDRRWREVLDHHDTVSRREVGRFGGRLVKTTGDGILATFDGPARAIRSAAAIRDDLAGSGTELRLGLHAGEVEIRGEDVGGIAVHIAARVMAMAEPGELLVSETVKGLVAGSGLTFADRGTHELKGFPDAWRIYALAG